MCFLVVSRAIKEIIIAVIDINIGIAANMYFIYREISLHIVANPFYQLREMHCFEDSIIIQPNVGGQTRGGSHVVCTDWLGILERVYP